MTRKSRALPPSPFRRFNSSPEVIRLVVMLYVRFPLSLRNVEDLLFERGIDVSHESIRFWWNRFGPMFAREVRQRGVSYMRGFRQWRWHLDEVMPFCCGFPWTYVEPRKPIRTAGGEDAGAFLANMLYDTGWLRGRVAAVPSPLSLVSAPNNHFDVTVEELLTLTAQKTLRFKNKGHISGKRGYPALACFQQSFGNTGLLAGTGLGFAASGSDFEYDGRPPEDFAELDFEDGISTLLMETGGEETR